MLVMWANALFLLKNQKTLLILSKITPNSITSTLSANKIRRKKV